MSKRGIAATFPSPADAPAGKRPSRRDDPPCGVDAPGVPCLVARSPNGHFGVAVARDGRTTRAWAWRAGSGRAIPVEGLPEPGIPAHVSVDDDGEIAATCDRQVALSLVARIPSSGCASIALRPAHRARCGAPLPFVLRLREFAA